MRIQEEEKVDAVKQDPTFDGVDEDMELEKEDQEELMKFETV